MTAVEFLVNRISVLIPEDIGSQLMFKSNVEKANKMFEQQIEEAVNIDKRQYDNAQQYYTSTYGSDTSGKTKQ